MYKWPKTDYIDYIKRKQPTMTNQTFTTPTLPTPAKKAAKKVWTPNMTTKVALTLLFIL